MLTEIKNKRRLFAIHNNCKEANIFLLIDDSGSVANDHPKIKSISCCFIDSVTSSGNKYSAIKFHSKIEVISELTSDASEIKTKLAKMVHNGGNTNLEDALKKVQQMISLIPKKEKKIIVIITDGNPSAKQNCISLVTNLIHTHKAKVACIGVGNIDTATIKDLSSEGLNLSFDNFNTLDQIYQVALQEKITNSEAEMILEVLNAPYKLGDNWHVNLKIRNLTRKVIPKGSVVEFEENNYFSKKFTTIQQEINPDETIDVSTQLFVKSDNIDDFEESINYTIKVNNLTLATGNYPLWISDVSGDLLELAKSDHNIGLFGTMGSGKTSFNCGVNFLFRSMFEKGHVKYIPKNVGGGTEHTTVELACYNFASIFRGSPISSVICKLWDLFGLSETNYKDRELELFLKGGLPHKYSMDDFGKITSIVMDNISTQQQRQIHSIIFVISQGDRLNQTIMSRLKNFFKYALRLDLQPIVVVTMLDDIQGLESTENVRSEVAKALDCAPIMVMIHENYHETTERNFEIDKSTYKIMFHALEQAKLFRLMNDM